jgi:GTPase
MTKFIDSAKVWIKAGDGGNGCVAFRREKFVPKGGPSGGNGGSGGNIVFVASKDIHTLIDFQYRQHFHAESGANGQGSNKEGRSGKDLVIPVPLGTIIAEIKGGREIFLSDLSEENACFVAAKGGKGGRGNVHFKSSTNRAPRTVTSGSEGEERYIKLELKLLADAGIIGWPNSGKSTLISRVSAAKPKTANYPFTTLVPVLGVVNLSDMRSFVISDMPGIIERASEGKGLGYQFLKHIERTKILIHLVDISQPDPLKRYYDIRKELEKYGRNLQNRTEIIVGNKIDIPSSIENIKIFEKEFDEVYFISALTGKGIKSLMEVTWEKIHKE